MLTKRIIHILYKLNGSREFKCAIERNKKKKDHQVWTVSLFFRNGIRLELKWKHRVFKLDKQMEVGERENVNEMWISVGNGNICCASLKMSPWKQWCDLHTNWCNSVDACCFYSILQSIVIRHLWHEFWYEFGLTLKWRERKKQMKFCKQKGKNKFATKIFIVKMSI